MCWFPWRKILLSQSVMSTLDRWQVFLCWKILWNISPRFHVFYFVFIQMLPWHKHSKCDAGIGKEEMYVCCMNYKRLHEHTRMRYNMTWMPNHPRLCQIRLSLIILFFPFRSHILVPRNDGVEFRSALLWSFRLHEIFMLCSRYFRN